MFVACAFGLVGCLEEESRMGPEEIETELKGVGFDLKRAEKYLKKSEGQLAELKKAESDHARIGVIEGDMAKVSGEVEEITGQLDELKASREESRAAFEKYQGAYRVNVRKAVIGQNVDLSATKGDEFKDVRVLSVNPLGIRIYTSSGPVLVPLSEIPSSLKERLQMSDEEAAAYRARQVANAKLRAQKYREWKKGLTGRQEEAAQKAIVKRLVDIQKEIEAIEKNVNRRILKIKDLKSRASQWEREFAEARDGKRRERALGYSKIYRDQAMKVTNQNSNDWLTVAALREEEEDLKKIQKPGR